MADGGTTPQQVEDFITHWSKAEASERANGQLFLTELAERVAATERALQSAPGPVTPAELAKTFTRAKPEALAEILDTLATLGRAHRTGHKFMN